MMMILGNFVFSLQTAAYQTMQRSTKQRWSKHDRFGQRAAHQHLGPGDDDITLPGLIYPELTGFKSTLSLNVLRDMADAGIPYLMLSNLAESGFVLGEWIILSVDETQSYFNDGMPQKIEFTIKLRRSSNTGLFDKFMAGLN